MPWCVGSCHGLPSGAEDHWASTVWSCIVAGMLSSCPDVFISCGAGGKMPHRYCPCTTAGQEVCLLGSFCPCWAARLQPSFLVYFNLKGNVSNTAFTLKGMLSSCFRLLVERINHSLFFLFFIIPFIYKVFCLYLWGLPLYCHFLLIVFRPLESVLLTVDI